MNNQPPTQCPICQSPIVEKEGISKKTNREFHFWGCSNYPNCDFIWHPPKQKGQTGGIEHIIKEVDQGTQILNAVRIVNDNIVGLHKKIDKVIDFLENKLG